MHSSSFSPLRVLREITLSGRLCGPNRYAPLDSVLPEPMPVHTFACTPTRTPTCVSTFTRVRDGRRHRGVHSTLFEDLSSRMESSPYERPWEVQRQVLAVPLPRVQDPTCLSCTSHCHREPGSPTYLEMHPQWRGKDSGIGSLGGTSSLHLHKRCGSGVSGTGGTCRRRSCTSV